MSEILFQPYPQRERTLSKSLLHSLAEGIFLFAFFLIFEPFSISDWVAPDKTLKLVGFALVTSASTFIHRQVFPFISPKFYEERNWYVWKEILSIFVLLLMIAFGNMIYGSFLLFWNFSFRLFVNSFLWVGLMAIFPVVFWVLADYIYQLKKYSKPVEVHELKDEREEEDLRLVAENEKDFLEIKNKQLLYIESSDNYCTVYYVAEGKICKFLIRSSLTRLESQISDEKIARTHRSYIANLKHVDRISGNAQGYFLHLNIENIVVPLARKYAKLVEVFK